MKKKLLNILITAAIATSLSVNLLAMKQKKKTKRPSSTVRRRRRIVGGTTGINQPRVRGRGRGRSRSVVRKRPTTTAQRATLENKKEIINILDATIRKLQNRTFWEGDLVRLNKLINDMQKDTNRYKDLEIISKTLFRATNYHKTLPPEFQKENVRDLLIRAKSYKTKTLNRELRNTFKKTWEAIQEYLENIETKKPVEKVIRKRPKYIKRTTLFRKTTPVLTQSRKITPEEQEYVQTAIETLNPIIEELNNRKIDPEKISILEWLIRETPKDINSHVDLNRIKKLFSNLTINLTSDLTVEEIQILFRNTTIALKDIKTENAELANKIRETLRAISEYLVIFLQEKTTDESKKFQFSKESRRSKEEKGRLFRLGTQEPFKLKESSGTSDDDDDNESSDDDDSTTASLELEFSDSKKK